jgi:hypothetical protein
MEAGGRAASRGGGGVSQRRGISVDGNMCANKHLALRVITEARRDIVARHAVEGKYAMQVAYPKREIYMGMARIGAALSWYL